MPVIERHRNGFRNISFSLDFSDILKGGGDANPGERHSRVTRDDGTVMLCAPRAANVLSRTCSAESGRP